MKWGLSVNSAPGRCTCRTSTAMNPEPATSSPHHHHHAPACLLLWREVVAHVCVGGVQNNVTPAAQSAQRGLIVHPALQAAIAAVQDGQLVVGRARQRRAARLTTSSGVHCAAMAHLRFWLCPGFEKDHDGAGAVVGLQESDRDTCDARRGVEQDGTHARRRDAKLLLNQ